MSQEQAPWATKLLSWHGHDRGGVRVPFQDTQDRPIPRTIETSLVTRLRNLAKAIADGIPSAPRYIFLVGGPGNGKSEAIEDFLTKLDEFTGMGGELVALLKQEFRPCPLIKQQVEVTPGMLTNKSGDFKAKVGRLLVIQDASATENAFGEAARELVLTIEELLTTPEDPPPIFLVCVNRGVLAHALKSAHEEWGANSEVANLLSDLIRASSLGLDALALDAQRPSCWPLAYNCKVACWPMDFESLIEVEEQAVSAFEQILSATVLDDNWASLAGCSGCASSWYCPFKQNLEWLRSPQHRANLLVILRRGELATGQRLNFRDTFSLVAELMVGQWNDFDYKHPCDWVHEQVQNVMDRHADLDQQIVSAYLLSRRLYPHALFAHPVTKSIAGQCAEYASQGNHPVSFAVADAVNNTLEDLSKHIRKLLEKNYRALDPADHTPRDFTHLLCKVEEAYSQSVNQGNESLVSLHCPVAPLEHKLLGMLADAEAEWNTLTRDWARAGMALRFLRRTACTFAKRSIGARWGYHAGEEYLRDYQEAIGNQAQLNKIRTALIPLFGEDKFRLNLLESFGQPQSDERGKVILVTDQPGIRAFRAPAGTIKTPRHDVPYLEVDEPGIRIPLTFDFYFALRLRQEGCAGSSLPASVRAAIDKVKHRYGGRICRDRSKFSYQKSYIEIGEYGGVGLDDEDASPAFQSFVE
jgi:hypothetical protein